MIIIALNFFKGLEGYGVITVMLYPIIVKKIDCFFAHNVGKWAEQAIA